MLYATGMLYGACYMAGARCVRSPVRAACLWMACCYMGNRCLLHNKGCDGEEADQEPTNRRPTTRGARGRQVPARANQKKRLTPRVPTHRMQSTCKS